MILIMEVVIYSLQFIVLWAAIGWGVRYALGLVEVVRGKNKKPPANECRGLNL